MERWHHGNWHRFRKNRSPNWQRRGDRFYSLEVVVRIIRSASTTLVDFLNGCLMGKPSLMKVTSRSPVPLEVVIVFAAYASHRLLEAGQLVFEVFHRMVKDVEHGRLPTNHLLQLVGLENKTWFISQIDIQPRLVPWSSPCEASTKDGQPCLGWTTPQTRPHLSDVPPKPPHTFEG